MALSDSAKSTVGPAIGSTNPAVGYGLALLAAVAWATGGLAAKWLFTTPGAQTAEWVFQPLGLQVDPVLLSAARAMVAFLMLFSYVAVRRPRALKVHVRDLPFLAVFGVLGLALVHFSYFKTISLTSVAMAILLEYLAPIIVLVVSVIFLHEHFTWALPGAVLLSVSGCALVVGMLGSQALNVPPEGLAWGLASAVLFAGYTLMGKYASPRFSSWTLLTYGLGFASLFWAIYLGGLRPVIHLLSDPRGLAAVSFVALISTVIPFGAFLKALRYIEATKASITATIEPVIAGLVAWVLFAEKLTVLQLAGGVLVIGAIVLSQRQPRGGAMPPAN